MATYNFRGKKITLNDTLVDAYTKLFNEEIRESLLTRYISGELYPSKIDEKLDTLSEPELSEIVTKWMNAEISANN